MPRTMSLSAGLQRQAAAVRPRKAVVLAQAGSAEPSKPVVSERKAGAPLIDRRQLLTGAAVTAVTLTGCPCSICKPGAAQAAAWSYGEMNGPLKWKGLCQTGTRQSPVNLPIGSAALKVDADMGDFDFAYGTLEKTDVLNTGHGTMQVNFQPGNLAFIDDMELELLQFHFHAPSEHAIDGKRYAMEVHLVHKNKATGNLAVLGIMMEPGGLIKNPAVAAAIDSAPDIPMAKRPATRPINPLMLLPKKNKDGSSRTFVHYSGSLTTPPCSEGVDWFVFTNSIKVPDSQILEFMSFVGDGRTYSINSRPLQPLNKRQIDYEL